jgi:hypothetical protein
MHIASILRAAFVTLATILSVDPAAHAKCAKWLSFLELGQSLPNAAIIHLRVTAIAQEERQYGARNIRWPVVVADVVDVLRGSFDKQSLRGSGDTFSTSGGFNVEQYAVGSEWVVWVPKRADRPTDLIWSDLDFWLGGCAQNALRVEHGRVFYPERQNSLTMDEFREMIRRHFP